MTGKADSFQAAVSRHRASGALLIRAFVALLAVVGVASAAGVKVTGSAGTARVSVVRRVELDYYLVTREKPLEFSVTGPEWLRVFTRLWLPVSGDSEYVYRLSLWQDDVERPLEFRTRRSGSSYGPAGQPVGRWRSFYIEVPAGENRYRLVLNDAPASAVGVRFSFRKPAAWKAVELHGRELFLVQAGNKERLYELRPGESARVEIAGPCRVRIRTRLNYTAEMQGAQNFVLAVQEQDSAIDRKNLRVVRSTVASYENLTDVVPSSEATVRFALGEGVHPLVITLSGTFARSAGIVVETIAIEKYE
ncbi:MAG: hypothetical protein ABIL25_03325 [candidate division WOR-3 bacterium]